MSQAESKHHKLNILCVGGDNECFKVTNNLLWTAATKQTKRALFVLVTLPLATGLPALPNVTHMHGVINLFLTRISHTIPQLAICYYTAKSLGMRL